MQPDISAIPHSLAQVLWIVLASSLGWLGGWLTRRKREPHEIAKISAETRQININTDASLIQIATNAIAKAEQLQNERLRCEEQLRNQIVFWRNKAEELDGELIDSRDANVQLKARLTVKQDGLEKSAALLHYHSIAFSNADLPEVRALVNILRERARENDA